MEIGEVYNQAQDEYKQGIFAVLNKLGGKGAERNVTGKTGTGRLKKFNDGDGIPGGRRYKTYTTKVIYNNYGETLDVTKNTIEDRDAQWEADLDEMRDLSIAASYSQDEAGMQLFNGGFATTVTVNGYDMTWYGDGEPLFSTIHSTVVPGASTQSNASSTGIRFNADNLETAEVALTLQSTDDGLALNQVGKPTVVLAPDNKKEGLEVTQSTLDPESGNNAINVFNGGMATDMVVSKFLSTTFNGSNNRWFLVIPGAHRLNHEVRQEPRLESDVNIKNKVVTFTVDARWANTATDFRNTWGSQGDLAAYSS